MKKLTVLSIFFLLAACISDLTPSPSPTGRGESPTPPPAIPTLTPIPTATISPQFVALQEQIAQNGMYTLNADGQVEMQTSEGMVIVPDILVSKDGTMTVTHNGETSEADVSTIVIDGQKITFKDKENKTWVWDGENLKEEVREFVPAETFDYVSNLSEVNLEVNPKADKEAIYWDFVGTLVSSLKLTDNNKAILEEVLNDESIPQDKRDSWSDLSNNSDKKLRLELMQAFLQKSGGKVDVTTIGYEVLVGADLNQPPIFESIQVDKIPDGYKNFIGVLAENGDAISRGAGKIFLNEKGQVVISIAHQRGVLTAIQSGKHGQVWYNNFGWTTADIESEAFLRLIEYHADRNVGIPLANTLTTDPSLYLYGNSIVLSVKDSGTSIRIDASQVRSGFLKIKNK